MGLLVISVSLILLVVGIVILTLKVSTRLGYRKIGIGIISLILIVILFIPTSFIFENLFFVKSDINERLAEHDIFLSDSFDIESKRISGIMDYTLQFELNISRSDKEKIINKLKDSPYLIIGNQGDMFDIRSSIPSHLTKDTIAYVTYEEDNYWNLQYCKALKNGYIRTWDMIQISKNNDKLNFIRNE